MFCKIKHADNNNCATYLNTAIILSVDKEIEVISKGISRKVAKNEEKLCAANNIVSQYDLIIEL